jgi:hypothetical protein
MLTSQMLSPYLTPYTSFHQIIRYHCRHHTKSLHEMMKVVIMMLCLISPLLSWGQSFNRDQVVGVWTSREISFAKAAEHSPVEKTTIDKMRRGLVNAQFIFKPNGLFFIRLPANAPIEFRELESMNNKMWHIRSKERMLFVGSLDEDLMMINVKITNGAYYFLIEDTPLVLKMERSR